MADVSVKIITVEATPPAESSGSDYNKNAPLNATEYDQTNVNLRAAIQRLGSSVGMGTFFSGLTAKATPVDGDMIPIVDSAASNALKYLSWAALKADSSTFLRGYTTTATAAGTTTLTVSSANSQFFTGSTTQIVVMPVTSTLVAGQQFRIVNNSTGVVTINSSGGNLIATVPAGTSAILTCILITGTTAASWGATSVCPITGNGGGAFAVGALTATGGKFSTTVANTTGIQLPRGGYIGFSNAADSANSEYILANGGDLEFGINGATKVTIASTGAVSIPGAVSTGALTIAGSLSQNANIVGGWAATFQNTGASTSGGVYINTSASSSYPGLEVDKNGSALLTLDASGTLNIKDTLPMSDHIYALGSTSLRWAQIWCTAGAFNSSDARLKTAVSLLTSNEIKAAQDLAKEIGTYQWLEAVALKGVEGARLHMGLTVQRAIEIMIANGLDWTRYGFIGYDKWEDTIVEHPAIEAVEASEGVEAVEAKAAWSEVTLKAGEAYSFRYDELNQFIHAGQQAKIEAQEARLAALEAKTP